VLKLRLAQPLDIVSVGKAKGVEFNIALGYAFGGMNNKLEESKALMTSLADIITIIVIISATAIATYNHSLEVCRLLDKGNRLGHLHRSLHRSLHRQMHGTRPRAAACRHERRSDRQKSNENRYKSLHVGPT
jgi:hypothetical protein